MERTYSEASQLGLDLTTGDDGVDTEPKRQLLPSYVAMNETVSLLGSRTDNDSYGNDNTNKSCTSICEREEGEEESEIGTEKESEENDDSSNDSKERSAVETFQKVVQKCFQPPVVGALMGLLVASQPRLRGLFVDLLHRDGDAPMEWFFDGLNHVGQAAVPINMIILGCNLNASYQNSGKNAGGDDEHKPELFSPRTTLAVVLGKMFVMPIVGFLSTMLLHNYVWQIPDDINGSFYLVVLIVFLTPTANNVMVMVELGGGGSREAIARTIAWQYAAAPIILSLTMTLAVGLADQWS